MPSQDSHAPSFPLSPLAKDATKQQPRSPAKPSPGSERAKALRRRILNRRKEEGEDDDERRGHKVEKTVQRGIPGARMVGGEAGGGGGEGRDQSTMKREMEKPSCDGSAERTKNVKGHEEQQVPFASLSAADEQELYRKQVQHRSFLAGGDALLTVTKKLRRVSAELGRDLHNVRDRQRVMEEMESRVARLQKALHGLQLGKEESEKELYSGRRSTSRGGKRERPSGGLDYSALSSKKVIELDLKDLQRQMEGQSCPNCGASYPPSLIETHRLHCLTNRNIQPSLLSLSSPSRPSSRASRTRRTPRVRTGVSSKARPASSSSIASGGESRGGGVIAETTEEQADDGEREEKQRMDAVSSASSAPDLSASQNNSITLSDPETEEVDAMRDDSPLPNSHYRELLAQLKAEEARPGTAASSASAFSLLSASAVLRPPNPPTDLQVVAVTSCSVSLRWKPPILDGGDEIFDYVITYSKASVQRVGKQVTRTFSEAREEATSRWMLVDPVHHMGAVLFGLQAGAEYGQISVTARNSQGTSGKSNVVSQVKLQPGDRVSLAPVPPSSPQFLRQEDIGPDFIDFAWQEPFLLHGSGIQEYILSFDAKERRDFASAGAKSFMEGSALCSRVEIRTGSAQTRFRLSDLLGDCTYTNFSVAAVSTAGLLSPLSNVIASLKTKGKPRDEMLMEELQFAVSSRESFIDSEVFNHFVQRYPRLDFIELLLAEIRSRCPFRLQEAQRIAEGTPSAAYDWTGKSRIDLTSRESQESHPLLRGGSSYSDARHGEHEQGEEDSEFRRFQVRRSQFRHRIRVLKQQIRDVHYNLSWCQGRQEEISRQIRFSEERLRKNLEEKERATKFDGEFMDSDIFHGQLQRFNTKELVVLLEEEIDIERRYISNAKKELIQVEDYRESDLLVLEKKEEDLRERYAGLKKLQNEEMRLQKGAELFQKSAQTLVSSCFEEWKSFREERMRQRNIARAVFTRMIDIKRLSAWAKWKGVVASLKAEGILCLGGEFDAQELHKRLGARELTGVGALALSRDTLVRQDMELNVRDLLEDIASAKAALSAYSSAVIVKAELLPEMLNDGTTKEEVTVGEDEAPLTTEKRREIRKGGGLRHGSLFRDWVEGDAHLNSKQNISRAIECFDRQLRKLKDLEEYKRETVQLHIRLARALQLGKKYSAAMVHLERAKHLSITSGDSAGQAESLLALGELLIDLKQFIDGVKQLESALYIFDGLKDNAGRIHACRSLASAYQAHNDVALQQLYESKARALERDSIGRLSAATRKLESLQKELLTRTIAGSCFNSFCLERAAVPVPHLRRLRVDKLIAIAKARSKIDFNDSIIGMHRKRIDEAQNDLEKAQKSGRKFIESSALTGNAKRYLASDFKLKIEKELKRILSAEAEVAAETRAIEGEIHNLKDDIAELEKELALNTAPLIRKVLLKTNYRLAALNAVNRRVFDVLARNAGAATGATQTVVATFGTVLGVYDLFSGVCLDLSVSSLPSSPGHTKTITCVFQYRDRVITGSADESIRLWKLKREAGGAFVLQLEEGKRSILSGHEAAVTALTCDDNVIVSGDAVCEFRVWSAMSLEILQIIPRAHYRSITTMYLSEGGESLATGSADGIVRFWAVDVKQLQSHHQTLKENEIREAREARLARRKSKAKEASNGAAARETDDKRDRSNVKSFEENAQMDGKNEETDSEREESDEEDEEEEETDTDGSDSEEEEGGGFLSSALKLMLRTESSASTAPGNDSSSVNSGSTVTSSSMSSSAAAGKLKGDSPELGILYEAPPDEVHSLFQQKNILSLQQTLDAKAAVAPPPSPSRLLRRTQSKQDDEDEETEMAPLSSGSVHSKEGTAKKLDNYSLEAEKKRSPAPSVTVLDFMVDELVYGRSDGQIVIWNLAIMKILRQIPAHSSAVTCLQMDSSRVISGATDGSVVVSDITTGQVLQTIRAHSSRILALQFDTSFLITVSADGDVRQWLLAGKKETTRPRYHLLGTSESIKSVARLYKMKLSDLLKLNGVIDIKRDIYPGKRLSVARGDEASFCLTEGSASTVTGTSASDSNHHHSKGVSPALGLLRIEEEAIRDVEQNSEKQQRKLQKRLLNRQREEEAEYERQKMRQTSVEAEEEEESDKE